MAIRIAAEGSLTFSWKFPSDELSNYINRVVEETTLRRLIGENETGENSGDDFHWSRFDILGIRSQEF